MSKSSDLYFLSELFKIDILGLRLMETVRPKGQNRAFTEYYSMSIFDSSSIWRMTILRSRGLLELRLVKADDQRDCE